MRQTLGNAQRRQVPVLPLVSPHDSGHVDHRRGSDPSGTVVTRRDVLLSSAAAALTGSFARAAVAQTSSSNAAMQRADELLPQMTIDEKAMQLSCVVPIAVLGRDGLMRDQADALLNRGSVISPARA